MNQWPIRSCMMTRHQFTPIGFLCVHKGCERGRFVCMYCLKEGIHKHNQENQNHILDLPDCYKIVRGIQDQFKSGDNKIYNTFQNIFNFLSKQFSLYKNNISLVYEITSENQILMLNKIQLDQLTQIILFNQVGYESELGTLINELQVLQSYYQLKNHYQSLQQNQRINYNNGDWMDDESKINQNMDQITERLLMVYKILQFISQRSYYEALQITNIALKSKKCFFFYFLKGLVLSYLNQLEDAIKYLDLSIEINPSFSDSQVLKAKIYESINELQAYQKIQSDILKLNQMNIDPQKIKQEIKSFDQVTYEQSSFTYQISRYQVCYCKHELFIVYTKKDDLLIHRQKEIQFENLSVTSDTNEYMTVQQQEFKQIEWGSQVTCMKFTNDNQYMQIGLSNGLLFQLQIEQQYLTKVKIKIHEEDILNIVNITNTLIITASTDCSIIVTDLVDQCQLIKIKAHQAPIYGLYYSQQQIISGSNDKSIKIFSQDGKQIIHKDNAHQDIIFQVQANIKSNKLYSCCSQKVKIWKIDNFLYELILEQTVGEDYKLFNFSLILEKDYFIAIYEDNVTIYSLDGQKMQQINHSVQDLGILYFYQKVQTNMIQNNDSILIIGYNAKQSKAHLQILRPKVKTKE